MKAGLFALLGAGAGFLVAGPMGAAVGALAGYVGSKVIDPDALREHNGWKVMTSTAPAVPPALLDNWASNAKKGIHVLFGIRSDTASGTSVATVQGKIYDVGTESNGRRYFCVQAIDYIRGPGMAGGALEIEARWRVYDNELVQVPSV